MSKALVISKKSVNSVLNERTLLSNLKHPFIVNMQTAFQDKENLYLIMDYLQGGDLRFHIGKNRRFNEANTSKYLLIRILYNLHNFGSRIHPHQQYNSQRRQTRKSGAWLARIRSTNRLRHCQSLQTGELPRHQWDARLHGYALSYKPLRWCASKITPTPRTTSQLESSPTSFCWARYALN